MMKIILILSFFASIGNAYHQYTKELELGTLGWVCSALWLSVLIIKEFNLEE